MGPIEAAALWSGLAILFLLALSVLVVRQRFAAKVAFGDGGNEALQRAIRVQGNAVEYIPIAVAGLVAAGLAGVPAWAVHVGGLLLLGGRAAHAWGLTHTSGASVARQAGMVATWTAMVWIAIACILGAV